MSQAVGKTSPPDLTMFDFSDSDIAQAAASDRLLSMEIEFSRECNYFCPYCYSADGNGNLENEMTEDEIRSALCQAAALGARKIVILGGEPLLYPKLREMIEYIRTLGMAAEIFTNGSIMTKPLAEFFLHNHCRMVIKLNTFDPEKHDDLTGVPGSLASSLRTLKLLQEAGYPEHPGLLVVSTVLSTLNIEQAPEMWIRLKSKGIRPYFECITPQGRFLENQELMPPPEQLRNVFETIAKIDREKYGGDWEPQPSLVGGKCFRHQYSCLVRSDGKVTPCVGLDAVIGDIRETPLAEILRDSQILRRLKNYRKYIKEPCRSCEKADHCYGCRGAAWQMTGDYLAADPTCWLNSGKLDRIRTLPTPVKDLLPHGGAMAFVEELLEAGEKTGVTRSVVRDSNPFLNRSGSLRREALVEYAAQSAAVLNSFELDGKIPDGLLIEIVNFRLFRTPSLGDEITVSLKKDFEMDIWHGIHFRISVNGRSCAEGGLKLCVFEK